MSAGETVRQRILAEAASRPISLGLMDTLTAYARSDIAGAIQALVADNQLREVRGRPGTYELAGVTPDANALLTILASRPRTLAELDQSTHWAPGAVQEAVHKLQAEGLVQPEETPGDVLRCTTTGLILCGWGKPANQSPERDQADVLAFLRTCALKQCDRIKLRSHLGWSQERTDATVNTLTQSGRLIAAGGKVGLPPETYQRTQTRPSRDVALELLRQATRQLTISDIGLAAGWSDAKTMEVINDLVERDLVDYDEALNAYSLPLQAYRGPGYYSGPPPSHPNGGPPTPPPPAPRGHGGRLVSRRDRLAETFAPIVLTWLEHADPNAPTFTEVARRCYALADAFLAEGSKGK